MRFAIIEPARTLARFVDMFNDPSDLYSALGLRRGKVDHGAVAPGIAIVVDEYGMFTRPQHYFAIGRNLYAGNAVLYGFDSRGELVDLPVLPLVIFMSTAGIEDAISRGQIDRPIMSLNDEKFWEWPHLPPFRPPEHP